MFSPTLAQNLRSCLDHYNRIGIRRLFFANSKHSNGLYEEILKWTQEQLEAKRPAGVSAQNVVNEFWVNLVNMLQEKTAEETDNIPHNMIRNQLLASNINQHWNYYCNIISDLRVNFAKRLDWYARLDLEKLKLIWPVTSPVWRYELAQQLELIAQQQRSIPDLYDATQQLLRAIREFGSYSSLAGIYPSFNFQQAPSERLPLGSFAQHGSGREVFSLTYGYRELSALIYRQLFLDDTSWHRSQPPKGQNHHVKSVENNNFKIHIKFLPDCPGIGYAINELHQRLIGHGTPATDIQFWPDDKDLFKIKEPYPVTISQTVNGTPLDEWPRNRPLNLDPKHFSDYFLMVLLKCPIDEKPGNFIVEDIPRTNLRRLINIDNDQALLESPVKKMKLTNNQQGYEIKLNLKSIVFCMPEMQQPLHPSSIDNFLSYDPYKELNDWLQSMRDFNKRLREYGIDESVCEKWFNGIFPRWLNPQGCVRIPFLFSDALRGVYQRFVKIQHLLREQPSLTHSELLSACLPAVATFYEAAKGTNPWEKFHNMHKSQYMPIEKYNINYTAPSTKLKTLTTANDISSMPATVSELPAQRALQHLKNMDEMQQQIPIVQAKLLHCDDHKNALRELAYAHPLWAEQAIHGNGHTIPPLQLGILDAETQDYILDAMVGVPFQYLDLKDCQRLTSKKLLNILISCSQLQYLNISNCQQLNNNDIANIANYCLYITHLYADKLSISLIQQKRQKVAWLSMLNNTPSFRESIHKPINSAFCMFTFYAVFMLIIIHFIEKAINREKNGSEFELTCLNCIVVLIVAIISGLAGSLGMLCINATPSGIAAIFGSGMGANKFFSGNKQGTLSDTPLRAILGSILSSGVSGGAIGAITAATNIAIVNYTTSFLFTNGNYIEHNFRAYVGPFGLSAGCGLAQAAHALSMSFTNLSMLRLKRLSLNGCHDLREIYLHAPKLVKFTAEAVNVFYCHLNDTNIFETQSHFPLPFPLSSRTQNLAQITAIPFSLQDKDEVRKIAEIQIPEVLVHWQHQLNEILQQFTKCPVEKRDYTAAVRQLSLMPEFGETLRYLGKYYKKNAERNLTAGDKQKIQHYFQEAQQWFKDRADDPRHEYFLGNLCHKLIRTTEQERAKAIRHYQEATASSDIHIKAKAHFQLGQIYQTGDCGASVNLKQAKNHYEQAIALGYQKASSALQLLESLKTD